MILETCSSISSNGNNYCQVSSYARAVQSAARPGLVLGTASPQLPNGKKITA